MSFLREYQCEEGKVDQSKGIESKSLIKRVAWVLFTSIVISSLVLMGCALPVNTSTSVSSSSDKAVAATTAFKVLVANSNLSSLYAASTRSLSTSAQPGIDLSTLSTTTQDNLTTAVNNPDYVFTQIQQSQQGPQQIDLANTILNGGTAQDVYNKLAVLDTSAANQYQQQMTTVVNAVPNGDGRALLINGQADLKSINLVLPTSSPQSRGLLASDWTWNTVDWYVGICATTTAGLITYRAFIGSWWMSWLGCIGLGIAIAGSAAMAYQIATWFTNTPEGTFIEQLFKYGPAVYNSLPFINNPNVISLPYTGAQISETYDAAILAKITNPSPLWQPFVTQILNASFGKKGNSYGFSSFITDSYNYIVNWNSFALEFGAAAAATVAPVTVCITVTPELISAVAKPVTSAWNFLVGLIPAGRPTLIINNVPLKAI